ncbi:unnamed protein product [Alternaria alternata]
MIETLKEMKHGKSGSYESLALERTASQILHRMEDKDSEDSLESTRTRVLDLLQRLMDAEGITSSGWLPATPQSHHAAMFGSAAGSIAGGNSSVASSVQPSRRGSAQPQDLLIDYTQGSPQLVQQSPQFPPPPNSAPSQTPFVNDFNTPYSHHHIQKPKLPRGSSDTAFQTATSPPKAFVQTVPRTNSDIIQQPKPMPVGQFQGPGRGRVQWNLGSEG